MPGSGAATCRRPLHPAGLSRAAIQWPDDGKSGTHVIALLRKLPLPRASKPFRRWRASPRPNDPRGAKRPQRQKSCATTRSRSEPSIAGQQLDSLPLRVLFLLGSEHTLGSLAHRGLVLSVGPFGHLLRRVAQIGHVAARGLGRLGILGLEFFHAALLEALELLVLDDSGLLDVFVGIALGSRLVSTAAHCLLLGLMGPARRQTRAGGRAREVIWRSYCGW
ncbi:hypothetical protein DFJ74DRAFT_693419 [Hyaloraphidium curvatum]|nr:hypothetical protein DFJ74DRAFT_693419 [Hyaloraphidium curvatum]